MIGVKMGCFFSTGAMIIVSLGSSMRSTAYVYNDFFS
jgi:hypothetical protein